MKRSANALCATCAIAGSVLLVAGTALHPMEADPSDSLAAFSEYAADRFWIASHLVQLAGFTLVVAALLLLAAQLRSTWSRLGAGAAIASLAVAAALQAVDGIALKAMVDVWAAAPLAQKEGVFHAAFAVRQVEVGLASMLSLLSGVTVALFGVALLRDPAFPKWLGGLAIAASAATALAGIVMAYTGFSGLAMAVNTPASVVLLAWMLAVGVLIWRRGG